MVTLQDAVQLISSDRAKDRLEGIELYKQIFGDPRTIVRIGHGSDDEGEQRWLRTLQALFNCVVADRVACVRRGSWRDATQPARRRLEESAKMVLWMVERVHRHLPSSVVHAAFNHITQMLVVRGELLEPLALSYIKALKCLISFRPNLEHLDDESWRHAAGLCFCIARREPITDDVWAGESAAHLFEATDDGVARAPNISSMLRPEQIEAAHVLHLLTSSAYAPFLDNEGSGIRTLDQYGKILEQNPTEKSIHLPTLQGLNCVIRALQTNESGALVAFSKAFWRFLLSLWTTKSPSLKEQVVIAVGSLVPYLSSFGEEALLNQLWLYVLREPGERHSVQPIPLASIRLAPLDTSGAFAHTALQLDESASSSECLSWVVLQLGADLLQTASTRSAKLVWKDDDDDDDSAPTRKRRKLGSRRPAPAIEVSSLFIKTRHNVQQLVWARQLLYFYVARHWSSTPTTLRDSVVSQLADCVSADEGDAQAWTMIALAGSATDRIIREEYMSIWQLALRLANRSSASRFAAHAAYSLLHHRVVENLNLANGIESLLAEIGEQASAVLFDSHCWLLESVLDFARSDLALSTRGLENIIYQWLQRTISRGNVALASNRVPGRATPTDFARLLLSIAKREMPLKLNTLSTCSQSHSIAEWASFQERLSETQSFLLQAVIPEDKSAKDMQHTTIRKFVSSNPTQADTCSLILLQQMVDVVSEEANDATFPSLRAQVDTCVAALFFIKCLESLGCAVDDSSKTQPYLVLGHILRELIAKGRQQSEVAEVLAALTPLSPGTRTSDFALSMVLPDSNSGISGDSQYISWSKVDTKSQEDIATKVWTDPAARPVLLAIHELLVRLLAPKNTRQDTTESSDVDIAVDDEFQATLQLESAYVQSGMLAIAPQASEWTTFASLTRTIGASDSRGVGSVWSFVLELPAPLFIFMASNLMEGMRCQGYDFSIDLVDLVFERLGSDLLANYQSERDVHAHLFSVEFLCSSWDCWQQASTEAAHVRERAMQLCHFFIRLYNKQKLHWQVEHRLARLLHKLYDRSRTDCSEGDDSLPRSLRCESLTRSMSALVGRSHAIVRLCSAKAVAQMFSELPNSAEASSLYDIIFDSLPVDAGSTEKMATRSFALGNILVTSSMIRQKALFHIIETSLISANTQTHVSSTLSSAASRLEFPSIAELWLVFASQLTWAIVDTGYSLHDLPFPVLGYKSHYAFANHTFRPAASILLAIDSRPSNDAFNALCNLAQRTKKDAILECLPFIFVSHLSLLSKAGNDAKKTLAEAGRAVSERISHLDTTIEAESCIEMTLDFIVVELLVRFYEEEPKQLLDHVRKHSSKIAHTLSSLQPSLMLSSNKPCKPSVDGTTVFESLLVLSVHPRFNALSASTIYSVVTCMCAKIYAEHFVNDKIRHFQALQMYLSTAWDTVTNNGIVLAQVMRSCCGLMQQAILFDPAQRLMLECLRYVKTPLPSAPSCLIRMAEVLKQFALRKDVNLRAVALKATTELHRRLSSLLADDNLRSHFAVTVHGWPEQTPATWTDRVVRPTPVDLIDAIASTSTVSSALLERLLLFLQQQGGERKRNFFSSEVWTFLDALKPKWPHGCDGDQSRFLGEIFALSEGRLERPAVNIRHPCNGHSKVWDAATRMDNSSTKGCRPLRDFVVRHLLHVAHSHRLDQAWLSTMCLRGMRTESSHFEPEKADSSDLTSKHELNLIGSFPSSSQSFKSRHRNELTTEAAVEIAKRFSEWVCWFAELVCGLLSTQSSTLEYAHLSSFLAAHVDIAEALLPAVLHIFYSESTSEAAKLNVDAMSKYVCRLFDSSETNPQTWSLLIQVILQMRNDSPSSKPLSADLWIKGLDFELLALRARQCGQSASALLFLETANEHPKFSRAGSGFGSYDNIELQYDIYNCIDDPDLFYGINNSNVRDSLMRRSEHEGRWSKVIELRAAEYEVSDGKGREVAEALRQQGYDSLAYSLKGSPPLDYEAAWRMQVWSLPVSGTADTASESLYASLQALHLNDSPVVSLSVVNNSLSQQTQQLFALNKEACKEASRAAAHLLCIREIRNWSQKSCPTLMPEEAFSPMADFETFELLSAVRLSLSRGLRRVQQVELVGSASLDSLNDVDVFDEKVLLSLSRRARDEGRIEIAINAVTKAQHAKKKESSAVAQEFANILWDQGDHAIAIDALSGLVTESAAKVANISDLNSLRNHGQALGRLGHWRATACANSSTATDIDCFRPALDFLRRSEDGLAYAEHCYTYAIFAEEQYRALAASEEAASLEAFISHREEEIKQLEDLVKAAGRSQAANRALRSLDSARKMVQLDRVQLSSIEKAKMRFKVDAGKLYAMQLSSADSNHEDQGLIRLVSLLFESAGDELFITEMSTHVKRIPSRKLLALTPQITSRLSTHSSNKSRTNKATSAAFQSLISDISFKLCRDHPFHALYALYSLAKGAEHEETITRRKASTMSQSSQSPAPLSHASRGQAAADLIERVKAVATNKRRLPDWQAVCDACVEWAQVNLPIVMPQIFGKKITGGRRKTDQLRIPGHLRIHSLRNVDVPVLTKDLPIDPSCQYTDFVSIARYSDRFTTAGGIHLPKIADCIGNDGKSYRQLFKNQDDLRQDAVMQQVFRLVNGLLKHDRRASQRCLQVRTYVVLPLGPQYGLLEFVGNTTPLLSPTLDLYTRHHKRGELTPAEARKQLAEAQPRSMKEKEAVFSSICQRMPPVFRLYFLERCTDPLTLLGSRLNYTRSVATTSIVGHILGLGDRHSSNILLDQQSGEVVHIDFGVAFDQGRLLPIPELVPFRLTRNIVDGMGLHGVEGVFRCGCRETLRVLRQGASIIKTVLEVFKYDPLYDWTQNPVKVIQGQANEDSLASTAGGTTVDSSASGPRLPASRLVQVRSSSGAAPNGEGKEVAELLAERAINSVMNKLSSRLSVEYTVNDLIIRARDPMYLGSIFQGWQAAL